MQNSHMAAWETIHEISVFAQRLAENGLVVTNLTCDWGFFGFWRINVQQGTATDLYLTAIHGPNPLQAPGPNVLRCSWDNRDCLLVIDSSPTRPLSAPNQWTRELNKRVDDSRTAMNFAETFIDRYDWQKPTKS